MLQNASGQSKTAVEGMQYPVSVCYQSRMATRLTTAMTAMTGTWRPPLGQSPERLRSWHVPFNSRVSPERPPRHCAPLRSATTEPVWPPQINRAETNRLARQ
jgi:hypothetical protein